MGERRKRQVWGRWLGIVYIDREDLNAELVEKGHAREHEEN